MAEATATPDVETASAAYARRFAGPVGAWFLQVQARIVLDVLAALAARARARLRRRPRPAHRALVDAGHEVTVFGSPGACGDLLRPWVDRGRVHYREGDLRRAPWPDRAFDVVLSFRLLPHVADWRALVGELCRLAARAVVVDYPTARSVNAAAEALFGVKKAVEGDTRPFTVFRDADVRGAFAASGFRATARRPEFFFPMALHRAIGAAPVARGLEAGARALGLTRALGSPVVVRAERHGR